MSLLSQTARYLLLSALALALLGSVGFYVLIHRTIRHEVDEMLDHDVRRVAQQLRQLPPSAPIAPALGSSLRITASPSPRPPAYTDRELPNPLRPEQPIPFRQLQQTEFVHGRWYTIQLQQPYDEFDELTRIMSAGVILGFLLLMCASVVLGLGLSRRLWRPFHATIAQLGAFRLDQPTELALPTSRVQEFNLLNQSLGELTRKLRRQFLLQKQFTENASHELQTPLAIASAELDMLMQSERLAEPDWQHLQRATDALGRLNQLNRSLLLLTQVENQQFADAEALNLSDLLPALLADYAVFFQHRQLTVSQSLTPGVLLRINRQLLGVLLTNLLKNAARHSTEGGQVRVVLTPDYLLVSNSGEPLPFAEERLFGRFVKHPARPDSTGLGLALVRQIAQRYALPVGYRYDHSARTHTFTLGLHPVV